MDIKLDRYTTCLSIDDTLEHLNLWKSSICSEFRKGNAKSLIALLVDSYCIGSLGVCKVKCVNCRLMERYFVNTDKFRIECGRHKGQTIKMTSNKVNVIMYDHNAELLCNDVMIKILGSTCLPMHGYDLYYQYICNNQVKTIDIDRFYEPFNNCQNYPLLLREIKEPTIPRSTSDTRIPLKISTIESVITILTEQFKALEKASVWFGSLTVENLNIYVFNDISSIIVGGKSVDSRLDMRISIPGDTAFEFIRPIDPNINISKLDIEKAMVSDSGYFSVLDASMWYLLMKSATVSPVVARRWSYAVLFTSLMTELPFINGIMSDNSIMKKWEQIFHYGDIGKINELVIKASKRDSDAPLRYNEIANILTGIRINLR
jgi:hypothetical protein